MLPRNKESERRKRESERARDTLQRLNGVHPLTTPEGRSPRKRLEIIPVVDTTAHTAFGEAIEEIKTSWTLGNLAVSRFMPVEWSDNSTYLMQTETLSRQLEVMLGVYSSVLKGRQVMYDRVPHGVSFNAESITNLINNNVREVDNMPTDTVVAVVPTSYRDRIKEGL